RILGGQLAAALAVLGADRAESEADESARATAPQGEPLAVAYYQADDSVFVDDAYVVKGVPGRILWKLMREHAADGRISFTNGEPDSRPEGKHHVHGDRPQALSPRLRRGPRRRLVEDRSHHRQGGP